MNIPWKHIVSLGVTWALDKYVAKKLPKAIVDVLDLAAAGAAHKLPPAVQEALDRAQFMAAMAQLNAVNMQAAAGIASSLSKNEQLLKEARDAYERGKRK